MAAVEPHHPRAPVDDDAGRVRGEHQDLGPAHHVLQPGARLFHERGVAGQEPLVHQQHLRADRGREREAEPHHHAGAVDAHRQVDELAELGEVLHVLLQAADRGLAESPL